MPLDDLKNNRMMSHLIDTLDRGETIEHYGRLVFAMVARHFIGEDEVIGYLAKDPESNEEEARRLVNQVSARDYNPPHRDRILEWMNKQQFAICPEPEDPRGCNVYRDLKFPDAVYERINEYYARQ